MPTGPIVNIISFQLVWEGSEENAKENNGELLKSHNIFSSFSVSLYKNKVDTIS